MRYTVTALLLAVATANLIGCGQTGPLYMPPEPETAPQAQPTTAADSAAQSTKGP
jgi:predicted small lipoprotein YifL